MIALKRLNSLKEIVIIKYVFRYGIKANHANLFPAFLAKMKSGILLVNKPKGFTSFDVVAVLRGILKEKKIGHGGTLDPNVTGVLPIFIGRATKAIDLAPTHDKKYSAVFRLGIKTDTQDIWGEIIEENTPIKDLKLIEDAVLSFKGEIMQTPPMFSAIKINGKRLYDLAREGQTVERPQRKITVYDMAFEGVGGEENEYKFWIHKTSSK